MTITATPRKRDKLASQLTWLANRHVLGLPEDRRHDRIVPRDPRTVLVMPDGSQMACQVIDMSLSGAAIASKNKPEIGTIVRLGKTPGRIIRHIDQGFAVEFTRLQHPTISKKTSPARKASRPGHCAGGRIAALRNCARAGIAASPPALHSTACALRRVRFPPATPLQPALTWCRQLVATACSRAGRGRNAGQSKRARPEMIQILLK